VLVAAVAWPLLHGLAYSALDLGDPFPWYLTVMYPPLVVASASAVVLTARSAPAAGRPLTVAVLAALSAGAIGVRSSEFGGVGTLSETVREGHEVLEDEAFEKARRDAAMHLATIAGPDDVISTCFGWFAYEAIDSPISELCPLNTREPVGDPVWLGTATFGSLEEPEIPEGATIVETFIAEVGRGGRADVVRLADPAEQED
jgi:hypothetical protein